MVEFQDYTNRRDEEFEHRDEFSENRGRKVRSASGRWNTVDTPANPEQKKSRLPDLEELAAQGFTSAGRGRLKVDLTTPLEQAFIGGMVVCAIGLLIAVINIGEAPGWIPFSLVMGLLSFFMLYRSTDNYYFLDLPRRELMFHHQSIFHNGEYTVAPFRRIAAATSNGVKKKSKHSTWWEYATIIALDDGTHFPVSDYEKEDLLQANTKARLLADVIGCPYVAGQLECEAHIIRDEVTGKVRVEQRPRGILDELLPILLVVVGFGLVMFIASLF